MTSPTPAAAHSSPTEHVRRRHVWQNFNFWLVAFTAVYSLISLAALRVAILSSRMARQSADASSRSNQSSMLTNSTPGM